MDARLRQWFQTAVCRPLLASGTPPTHQRSRLPDYRMAVVLLLPAAPSGSENTNSDPPSVVYLARSL